MSYSSYDPDGTRRVWSDDEERKYHTYNEAGVEEPGSPRDFSEAENIVADVNAANDAAIAAEAARKAEVKLIITEVKTERDVLDAAFIDPLTGDVATNAVIKDSPGKYIKALKKYDERVGRALIDMARLLTD